MLLQVSPKSLPPATATTATTEIETIVVRGEGVDSIWFHPDVIANTPQPEWEDVVPKDAQSTRDELVGLADRYFDLFVDGDVSTFPFTDDSVATKTACSRPATAAALRSSRPAGR